MDEIIRATNLTKVFRSDSGKKITAIEGINLSVKPGEFFVVLGPSGCGKSTLLRIISGLEKSFQGELTFENKVQPGDLTFVFQQFALYPWLTVSENIELGLISKKISKTEKERLVKEELDRFDLNKFAKAFPKELSGGMKQRVGIARAWITKPKIIFMDEPFSELDSFTAEALRTQVLKIWQEEKTTIVMVTHLISEAIELADRIAILTKAPGSIEKIIENNITRPRNKRSQDFFRMEDEINKIIKP